MTELEPVVIELNREDTKTNINLNNSSTHAVPTFSKEPSVNFGGGIELLMNDKKRSNSTGDFVVSELSEL